MNKMIKTMDVPYLKMVVSEEKTGAGLKTKEREQFAYATCVFSSFLEMVAGLLF